MLRSITNSLLSLVIIVTSFWGGCISCEQFFMLPGTHRSCCNKSGQCERPGKSPSKPEKTDCNRLPLNRGGNAHAVPMPAELPPTIAAVMVQLPSPTSLRVITFEALLDPSPPDTQALHSTFLI